MKKINLKTLIIILAVLITASFASHRLFLKKTLVNPTMSEQKTEANAPATIGTSTATADPTVKKSDRLAPPLASARARVIKKPFGLKVSPNNSPISPEKFSGYHTDVDFEILAGEENKDVIVSAICSGPLALKKYASGYGGVAVQNCLLDSQNVTIIYGHLKSDSIKPEIDEQIFVGEQIALLGQGYSAQTDGERKHLHLGIHKGKAISLLGYVSNPAELSNWLDALKYLP